MNEKKFILILSILALSLTIYSQDRFSEIRNNLNDLAKTEEGLKQTVQINLGGSSIQTFVRGMAATHKLNVNIDPTLNFNIVNNFSDAKVIDVFIFLCKEYDLGIEVIGSIISINKASNQKVRRDIRININDTNGFISFNLQNDSLGRVTQKITKLTNQNIILAPGLEGIRVSGFIQNRPVESAIDKLALANSLKMTKTKDGYLYLERVDNNNGVNGNRGANFDYTIDNEKINVTANDVETSVILKEISLAMGKNYFLYSQPKTQSTINIKDATYDDFLTYLLNGTELTYNFSKDVYLIGPKRSSQLKSSKLIKLRNRRVEGVLEAIHDDIKAGVNLIEFVELNGLIASGSGVDINRVEQFIRSLDVVVPVVNIEILIAEVSDSRSLSTGISAGLSSDGTPSTTQGSVLPGVNLDLSTDAINQVVSGINGLGIINLGKISSNFYLQIEALESSGDLKIESTPSLATLNGHEATLKIGEKTYYLQLTNNFVGSQIPQTYQSQNWQPVEANLEIKINPMVSEGEQVTLDIKVEETNFTDDIVGENAPPGTITRQFESMVRVRNGDMILLGGLERKLNRDNTAGFPLLSRIPIIKWFFSSRQKEKTKGKLTIFIRPTISYK